MITLFSQILSQLQNSIQLYYTQIFQLTLPIYEVLTTQICKLVKFSNTLKFTQAAIQPLLFDQWKLYPNILDESKQNIFISEFIKFTIPEDQALKNLNQIVLKEIQICYLDSNNNPDSFYPTATNIIVEFEIIKSHDKQTKAPYTTSN
ncbi:Hypothetical_protein [Hexamita inflata]|uniref:Hypothetical_protein n=1 Tax=Hexamita inflata TaxID=28002 RepID=A0AA86VS94_9EUKA|nr:Hypothetical protein HINF_LOCUS63198 [Hexamita inflata]